MGSAGTLEYRIPIPYKIIVNHFTYPYSVVIKYIDTISLNIAKFNYFCREWNLNVLTNRKINM